MRCLFLDLASHDALIACVTDKEVLASQSVQARIGDHELIPMTEDVLKKAKWKFDDLDSVACVVGPGGFTSLRVAVTFANTLADQLNIPSVGIHLSDLYRARAGARAGAIFWLHSTKKDQLFVCGGKWKEPTLIHIDEIAKCKMQNAKWMGELIDEHRAVVGFDPVALQSIQDVLPTLLSSQQFNKELLTPWYGRGW